MITNDDRGGGVKITENLLTSYVKKSWLLRERVTGKSTSYCRGDARLSQLKAER